MGKYIKKKEKRRVLIAEVYIYASFNNTIITITDLRGNTLIQMSAGRFFKGTRKSTPHASQVVGQKISKEAVSLFSIKVFNVKIKGPGGGREQAIKPFAALAAYGVRFSFIRDITGTPHNGCRPPKKRRM